MLVALNLFWGFAVRLTDAHMDMDIGDYTVVAESSLYFVLLNYSYKPWSNVQNRDSFGICTS